MRGDKLLIEARHRQTAETLADRLIAKLERHTAPLVVTIAGESGCGKSETAVALSEALGRRGVSTLVLQQDDYFHFPPKTNAAKRREDLAWVGPGEVRLDLLDRHAQQLREGATSIVKPLVLYEEDRIVEEKIDVGDARVVVVEGTYSSLLDHADLRIFIERTAEQARRARTERDREAQDEWLERVLRIEHGVIVEHKDRADYVITPDDAVLEHAPETAET